MKIRVGLLFIYILFFTQQTIAQSSKLFTVGTTGQDYGDLVVTNGQLYIVGYTQIAGLDDAYITSLDQNFAVQWSKKYHSLNGDRVQGMVTLENGNLLASGSRNNGNTTFLAELDANGGVVKGRTLGSFQDRLQKLIVTNDKGYLNFGELEGLISGRNQVALIKYNKNQQVEWRYHYSYYGSTEVNASSFEMYARTAVQMPDSSFWVLGSYTEISGATRRRKIRLLKLDKNGQLQWVKGFHSGKTDNAIHMSACQDGGVIIAANSDGYSSGDTDVLLIKTDANGDLEWMKTYGSTGNEGVGQVRQLPNNAGFIICGNTNGFGAGKNDALLFQTNHQGVLQKAWSFGGTEDDYFTRMDTLNGKYLVSGNTRSYGSRDILVLNTDISSATIGCGTDALGLMSEKSVTSTFYQGSYLQSTFSLPTTTTIIAQDVSSSVNNLCTNCPANTTQRVTLCNGQYNLDMSQSGAVAYTWNDGYTQPNRTISNVGTYWVDINLGSCSYRRTIEAQKLPSNSTLQQLLCAKEVANYDFTDSQAVSYIWNDGYTQPSRTLSNAGTYWVDISWGSCSYRRSIVIQKLPENSTTETALCARNTINYDFTDGQAVSYTWNDGYTQPSRTLSNAGTYWVDISWGSCSYRRTIILKTLNATETLDLGDDKTLSCGESLTLDATISGAQSYLWNNGSSKAQLSVTQSGVYQVKVFTPCEVKEDSVRVEVINDLFIPNVFTPNGDGVNDYFELRGNTKGVVLKVVNRWGRGIFSSDNYQNNWDGNNLKKGTYVYYIKDKCTGKEYKGWVQILR